MTSRHERLEYANCNETQKAGDKNIRGQQEYAACLLHSAQIDNGDENENPQTQAQRLALQRRHRRNQRAHSSRDADCRSEHVIDHERRRSQQAGSLTQIFRRDRVRAAAVWIGRNRLPVGEVHDAEQDHDADRNRPYIDSARHAQRDQ